MSIEPDLIVANSSPVVAALKRATGTIPIVFAALVDPVGQGFVASLAHPGGNITGFTLIEFEIIGKWLELLKEMAPSTRRTTLLLNPMMAAPFNALLLRWLQVAPNTLATEFAAAPVQDKGTIEAAIAAVAREPGGGLIAGLDVFTLTQHALIVSLAERYRVPAIYASRRFAIDGGLMVYRPDTTDIFRRSASYVDRILKGAKPADLPIQQPTKFEMIISLRAAKALGLDVPLQLQQLADDVIE